MTVIVIMALLSAAAAFTLAGPIRTQRRAEAVGLIRQVDSSARRAAHNRFEPVAIEIDLEDGRLSRREGGRDGIFSFAASLPPGIRIDQVRAGHRAWSDGTAVITCSSAGMSPTYAVHLVGEHWGQWFLFAGLTGQMTQVRDADALDAILGSASAGAARSADRDDAD